MPFKPHPIGSPGAGRARIWTEDTSCWGCLAVPGPPGCSPPAPHRAGSTRGVRRASGLCRIGGCREARCTEERQEQRGAGAEPVVNLQVSGQARRAGREAWHRRGGWTVTSVQMPPLQTGAAPRGSAAGPRPLLGSRAGWGREEPQSPADDSRFLPPSLLSLVSLQGRRWPQHTAPVGGEQLPPPRQLLLQGRAGHRDTVRVLLSGTAAL